MGFRIRTARDRPEDRAPDRRRDQGRDAFVRAALVSQHSCHCAEVFRTSRTIQPRKHTEKHGQDRPQIQRADQPPMDADTANRLRFRRNAAASRQGDRVLRYSCWVSVVSLPRSCRLRPCGVLPACPGVPSPLHSFHMRIVGKQDRSEIELDPVKAWQRGRALDDMLRAALPPVPRGVTR